MTVMPKAADKVQRAPRWLKLIAGVLLFPIPCVGLALTGNAALPLRQWQWLLIAALPAAWLVWLVIRRASMRQLVPVLPIVLVGYVALTGRLCTSGSRAGPLSASIGEAMTTLLLIAGSILGAGVGLGYERRRRRRRARA